jgi:hypothetical protein
MEQIAQGLRTKIVMQINELHVQTELRTGSPPRRASIGAAVEFYIRASLGFASG